MVFRLLIHLLGCPRWASPLALEVRPPQRMRAQCRAPVSCVFPAGPSIYPGWRLGFRQSSFSHIARVSSARRPYASARPLVSWHAIVPFTFQIQVSHQTQEYPPNSSRLSRGYNRAPRGAELSLGLSLGFRANGRWRSDWNRTPRSNAASCLVKQLHPCAAAAASLSALAKCRYLPVTAQGDPALRPRLGTARAIV